MKAILSLSGGLDSTALLLNLLRQGYDIHTISYYYGQKNKVELDGLARILHYLEYQQYTIENKRVVGGKADTPTPKKLTKAVLGRVANRARAELGIRPMLDE